MEWWPNILQNHCEFMSMFDDVFHEIHYSIGTCPSCLSNVLLHFIRPIYTWMKCPMNEMKPNSSIILPTCKSTMSRVGLFGPSGGSFVFRPFHVQPAPSNGLHSFQRPMLGSLCCAFGSCAATSFQEGSVRHGLKQKWAPKKHLLNTHYPN